MSPNAECILAAVDFTDPGRHALRRAADLAMQRNASLIALHVVEEEGFEEMARVTEIPLEELRERIRGKRQESLRAALRGLDAPKTEALLVFGRPSVEIVKKAREFAADWIVLGAAGRSADAERVLFGGTAEKVLRAARCPVVCIPYPG